MGSGPPTTVNPLATTVDGVINFSAFKVLYPMLITFFKTKFVFLNFPIISQLFDWFMNRMIDDLYVPTVDWTNTVIIQFQTDEERNKYSAAEQSLRHSFLKGDQNEIQKASDNFDSTLESLIHWDGSASP